MKVRAIQDGHYGGYYRTEGEIFEIDAKPYVAKDENGNPVLELDEKQQPIPVLHNGKPKLDEHGKPVFRVRMASFFAKEWMEQVDDDADVTNDYPPFQIPAVYRAKKEKPSKVASAPVMESMGSVI